MSGTIRGSVALMMAAIGPGLAGSGEAIVVSLLESELLAAVEPR